MPSPATSPDDDSAAASPPALSSDGDQPSTVQGPTAPNGQDNLCRTTDGDFGSQDGEALTLDFQYAVELDQGLSEEDYLANVISDLEFDMADYVILSLFDESLVCMERRTLRDRGRRLANLIGLSAHPLDSVLKDADCTGVFCYSMLGQMTLFFEKDSTRRNLQAESEAEQVKDALRVGMNAGIFDNNPPIVKVSYVEGVEGTDGERGVDGVSGTESVDENSSSGPSTRQLVGWIWFGILGALFILAILYVLRRRRQNRNNQAAFP